MRCVSRQRRSMSEDGLEVPLRTTELDPNLEVVRLDFEVWSRGVSKWQGQEEWECGAAVDLWRKALAASWCVVCSRAG